jgi:IstB-like ATP binding protein
MRGEGRCPCWTEPTLEQLKALRLDAFAAAWLAQQQDPALAAIPFDERLGLLVEAEWLARENRRLATALREAKLRLSQACVEDIGSPSAAGSMSTTTS